MLWPLRRAAGVLRAGPGVGDHAEHLPTLERVRQLVAGAAVVRGHLLVDPEAVAVDDAGLAEHVLRHGPAHVRSALALQRVEVQPARAIPNESAEREGVVIGERDDRVQLRQEDVQGRQ